MKIGLFPCIILINIFTTLFPEIDIEMWLLCSQETQGIPVIKIGETPEFPAFYCSETSDKIKAPYRVSNTKKAADIVKTQRILGINTGILFTVSIPEKYTLKPDIVDSAISEALERASAMHITGKQVTPFLLNELNKITCGQSLEASE